MIESWLELRRDAQGHVVDERWVQTGHNEQWNGAVDRYIEERNEAYNSNDRHGSFYGQRPAFPRVIQSPAERARRQFANRKTRV